MNFFLDFALQSKLSEYSNMADLGAHSIEEAKLKREKDSLLKRNQILTDELEVRDLFSLFILMI